MVQEGYDLILSDYGALADRPIFVVMHRASADEPSGSWDSIHVFETAERGRQAHYKLTSTIMLQLVTRQTDKSEDAQVSSFSSTEKRNSDHSRRASGEVNLSGSMTRQVRANSELS